MNDILRPRLDAQRLSVDVALNQPLRLTKRVSDLLASQLLATHMLSAGQPPQGGGIAYTQLTPESLFAPEPENRAILTEYGLANIEEPPTKLALVEDFGSKFVISDEARKRNLVSELDQKVTMVSNAIKRKLDRLVLETVTEAVDGVANGALVIPANDWSALDLTSSTPTPSTQRPEMDIALVQATADRDELGYTFDKWIVSPTTLAVLKGSYGEKFAALEQSSGVQFIAHALVPDDEAFAIASGQVGFLSFETPITTELIDERKIHATTVQVFCNPVVGVTAPHAVRHVTGLAGGA